LNQIDRPSLVAVLSAFAVFTLPAHAQAAELPEWQLQFELVGTSQQIEVAWQTGQNQLRFGLGGGQSSSHVSKLYDGSERDLNSWHFLVAPGYRRYLAPADAQVAPFVDVEATFSRAVSDDLPDGVLTSTRLGGRLGGGLEVRPLRQLVISGRVFAEGSHVTASSSTSSLFQIDSPSTEFLLGAAAGLGLNF
jgi:hypothetical protein